MADQWAGRMAAVLSGPDAAVVLRAVLEAVGATLHASEVRSVHRRGRSEVAVVHRVELTDGRGQRRDRLYVTHASTRDVPEGAAQVEVDGTVVHVWQFPHDPYLPALPAAVNRATTAALLRRHGHDTERPGIHTRSYRPTRRAVVELRRADDTPPVAYVKVLGGRRPARVRERTGDLVDVHTHLLAGGLPVPRVLEHDVDVGRVVLDAVPGATLRHVLRSGGTPPAPARTVAVLQRLHGLPAPRGGGDPDGFADVTRHVAILRNRLPERTADLDRLAAVTRDVGGPTGTIHGDLHDGQLLVDGDVVTGLLDVDGVGTGHVAHDAGRLLAGIEASGLAVAGHTAAVIAGHLDAMRDALTDVAPPHAIAAATAAAWVGLATGPLRVASPDWRTEVGQRLDLALMWAEQAA